MEGHVHLGDAGLEDEDEEMEDEGNESEGDEVESIVDIKIQNGIFKYRVRWVGCKPSEDTWEPEESFTGDTCRGSVSPTPPPAPKGRQRKTRTPSKRTTKRKAAKEETTSTSPSDKPPIVLKLTLKKADKPAKREKRAASEKSPKEKKKREKKSSLQTVVKSPSPEEEVPQPASSSKAPKVEATQASQMAKAEVKPKVAESSAKPQTTSSAAAPAQAPEASNKLPAPKDRTFFIFSFKSSSFQGRRRALHLLPGPITINEPLTTQVLNNMLRDLEIKYYGDEERHPYSQEQFNESILSGNFMRVRKAMVNNLLTAPRLAMWTNPYGVNLLHLLCRTVKCDERHAGDDIATVLCNIAPTLLTGRDNNNRLPIHDAVDKGQVCRVYRLLTFHSPVNVIDRNGNSPLSLAYAKNHAKMVRILLQGGANFWQLELNERRKPENMRKRRAFEVLTKHSRILLSQLVRARRKVYRLLTEVRTTSPCFTAPFADGPEFTFNYHHIPLPIPENGGQYGHILFLHVLSVKPEGGILQARCWGGLRLAQAPVHNNRPMDPTSITERGDHMMFFITPINGANSIHIRISDVEQ
ncbi:ankyrin repeat protein [Ancylostoma duodenale]|uniref:Ankyrin repeat protein n=1 Tax=Ancylostoma duodenale TaxID=51022 RepID=A0A0C2CY39_9BILA|nr:ankyrin repeat protein [Ancylostoma duodenale]